MARKRGGIAGIYDRNKTLIKTIAPIAAGFIPGVGPLVGAALGAAMGGDTEGKGYFKGFNAGGAVKGGLSGYGGAKLGQAAKGGLAKMFTASPLDKLTGAPQVGLTAGGPSSYGAMGSFQPTMAGGVGGAGAAAGAGAVPAAAYTGNVGGYGIGMPLGSAAPVPSSAMADLPAMDMTKMRKLTQTTGASIPAPRVGAMPNIPSPPPNPTRNPFSGLGSALKTKEGLGFAGSALQTGASLLGAQAQGAREDREYEEQQRQLQARAELMALFAPQMAGNLGMGNFSRR